MMFRYVDALCQWPLYMYPKVHTHTRGCLYVYAHVCVSGVCDCASVCMLFLQVIIIETRSMSR